MRIFENQTVIYQRKWNVAILGVTNEVHKNASKYTKIVGNYSLFIDDLR